MDGMCTFWGQHDKGWEVWSRTSIHKKPFVATAYWSPVVMRLRCVLCGLKGFKDLSESSLHPKPHDHSGHIISTETFTMSGEYVQVR